MMARERDSVEKLLAEAYGWGRYSIGLSRR
jgi:hypothetical protein